MQIKNSLLSDGPREKLFQYGVHTLSNSELLAVILGTGTREKNVLELSQELLNFSGGSLVKLQSLTVKELSKIKGIGKAKATSLAVVFELAKRQRKEKQSFKTLSSSSDVFELASSLLLQNRVEEFWVIFLNRSNRVIGQSQISKGGMSATVVDIRIIAHQAIENGSSAVILFHNHPSGNNQPSTQDLHLTDKIVQGLKLLDICVLDHLILAGEEYYSFADEGKLTG